MAKVGAVLVPSFLLFLLLALPTAHCQNSTEDALLTALIRLESAIRASPGCHSRIRALWSDVGNRAGRLKSLQEGVLARMDDLAGLRMESPQATACEEPFESVSGACLYSPPGVKLRSWVQARFACGRLGGDLAHPQEMWAVQEYVRKVTAGGFGFYFIGGYMDDSGEYEQWRWIDGRPVVFETGIYTQLPRWGDCLSLDATGSHKVKSKDCTGYKRWFVCEVKVKAD